MSNLRTSGGDLEEPRCCCCRVSTGFRVVVTCEVLFLIIRFFAFGYLYIIDTRSFMFGFIEIVFDIFGLCAFYHLIQAALKTGSVIIYLVYKYLCMVENIAVIIYLGYGWYPSLKSGIELEELLRIPGKVMLTVYGPILGLFSFLAVYYIVSGIAFLVIAHKGRGYLSRKLASPPEEGFINQNNNITHQMAMKIQTPCLSADKEFLEETARTDIYVLRSSVMI